MTPRILLETIIRPTLALMGERYDSPRAESMLLAIALQESGISHRRQIGGPARGFWQFEIGGVRGVIGHDSSKSMSGLICESMVYKSSDIVSIHAAIEHNDILACAFARLLLWTHPKPLPNPNDLDSSWAYYQWLWRPVRAN